jgi:S1-C subfamily serine protease
MTVARKTLTLAFGLLLACGLIAGLTACGSGPTADAETPAQVPDQAGQPITEVIKAVRPGVVRVNVKSCDAGAGTGSGFVYGPRLVATADHVVTGASSITVRTETGAKLKAVIVGHDPKRDLALLRTTKPLNKPGLVLDASKDPDIGAEVRVLGFPRGLPFTATRGTITGLGRNLTIEGNRYVKLLQTDATVNPGNSGGALIDETGRVVGIVVAGASDDANTAFGVPAKRAAPVLEAWASAPEPVQPVRCTPTTSSASGGSSGGSNGGSASADCTNPNACPAISSVRASDSGGTLDISADYCDRTPGDVNEFQYTFAVIADDGTPVGGDEQFMSQTRACNTISTSIGDSFPAGTYTVVVRVDNLTNGVGGRAESSTFRIQ